MPWSTSSSAPCAPSNRMRLPARRSRRAQSQTRRRRRAGSWARPRAASASSCVAVDLRLCRGRARSALWWSSSWSTLASSVPASARSQHADGAAADLVLVGRADAAAGGADLAVAGGFLARRSSSRCSGRISVRVLGDAQVLGRDVDALACERARSRRSSAQGSTTTPLPMTPSLPAHHARGQQRQLVGVAVDDQRVAGIVAALEAHDDVGALGQPVDDLALALVAPLGADHDDVGHS